MILASSNILGIAVTDRLIACAELSGRGDRAAVERTAIYTPPNGQTLDKPEEAGAALALLLKEKGFTATKVVVGVPAKWLIAAEKDVPPAGREQMRTLLRLQAERLPLAEAGELVFDFVGEHQPNKPGRVLLVAMLQKQIERIEKLMEAAGLTIVAVTPTSLALISAIGERATQANKNVPMLLLGRSGAEVVFQTHGVARMLRHVGVTASNGHGLPALAPLGTELRRAVAMGPASTEARTGPDELLLVDSAGLDAAQVAELSERLGWKLRTGDGLAMLGIKAPPRSAKAGAEDADPRRFAPVAALALAGADRHLLPFNFIKSRLAPPPVRRFGKKSVWVATIAALLVLGIGFLQVDAYMAERDVELLVQQKTDLDKPLKAAQDVKDKVDFSSLFFNTRTPMLDGLREMSQTFHDDEDIWVTNLHIEEPRDGKSVGLSEGRIEGKTRDMAIALALYSRMANNPKFKGVSIRGLNPGGSAGRGNRGGGDLTGFSISFTYVAGN